MVSHKQVTVASQVNHEAHAKGITNRDAFLIRDMSLSLDIKPLHKYCGKFEKPYTHLLKTASLIEA